MVRSKLVESYFVQSKSPISDEIVNEEDYGKVSHMENLLKSWLDSQPNFPKNYDENLVRNFLRGSKYRLEKCKQKLESYLTARDVHSNLLTHRSPTSQEIIDALNHVTVICIPQLSEKGEVIWLFRLEDADADAFDIVATMKTVFMCLDLVLTISHPTQGFICIFDAENFTGNHFFKFFSNTLRNSIDILRNSYAIRLNQIHIINGTPLIDNIVSVIRPLLPKVVRSRFIFHKSKKSLHSYCNPNFLPSNYGGDLKRVEDLKVDCHDLLKSHSKWFEDQKTCKISEPSNKKMQTSFGDEMGVEGSFRKLNID